jgi:hypothetical protein
MLATELVTELLTQVGELLTQLGEVLTQVASPVAWSSLGPWLDPWLGLESRQGS